MKAQVLLVLILTFAGANAAESVVLGRAVADDTMDYVENSCEENEICLDHWHKWIINVEKTISGPTLLPGHVVAARMQHATMIPSYRRRMRLFVLRPIEDEAQRRALRATHYLLELSAPQQMFCVLEDPNGFGLNPKSTYVNTSDERERCFPIEESR